MKDARDRLSASRADIKSKESDLNLAEQKAETRRTERDRGEAKKKIAMESASQSRGPASSGAPVKVVLKKKVSMRDKKSKHKDQDPGA
jgi:hypothetical protein